MVHRPGADRNSHRFLSVRDPLFARGQDCRVNSDRSVGTALSTVPLDEAELTAQVRAARVGALMLSFANIPIR